MGLLRNAWTVPLEQTLIDISVDNDLSAAIDIQAASFGMIYIPQTFNGTSISFEVCDTEDGTFVPLNDDAGSPESVTVTDATAGAVAIPDAVFGARYMKLKCGSAQTDTDTQLIVTLKG